MEREVKGRLREKGRETKKGGEGVFGVERANEPWVGESVLL